MDLGSNLASIIYLPILGGWASCLLSLKQSFLIVKMGTITCKVLITVSRM